MAESSNVPASALTACDRCHSRKVRCDRLDPCKGCVAANTVCGRLRRKTRQRKPNPTERIRMLTERMHQLENMVHDHRAGLDEDLPDAPAISGQILGLLADEDDGHVVGENYEGSNQDSSDISKEFMNEGRPQAAQPLTSQTSAQARSTNTDGISSSGEIKSTTSSIIARTETTHADIATSSGEPQLDISVMQRVALDKILASLDEFSKAPSLHHWSVGSYDDAGDDKGLYDLTPSDIINVLAKPHTPISSLHWSNSTLATSSSTKTIGMELLDGKVQNESKTLPYKIILNFQAAMLLDRQEELPEGIQKHIEPIKRRKFFDVLLKLDRFTFRTPPSFHMLRAQCMGVVILQSLGNVPEAWSMMVAAARTFVALGCDTSQTDSLSSTNNKSSDDPIDDREACIAWCYQLDRSMSLLLHRPPLLPKSSTPPRLSLSPLDNGILCKLDFIHLSLDLTHIQGLMLFITRDAAKKRQWKDLEPLHNELKGLWERLDTWESGSPGTQSELFVRDVDYLRFRGYATQAILLQLSPEIAKSSLLQRVAVDCARKCFESFRDLAKDGHKIEMIDLSWDLLLYSLSPLCVLTYNIVRTREAEDLKLLEDFVIFIFTCIIKKSPDNPLATRIGNLYRSIVVTCRPLISAAPSTTAGQPTYPTNHTPHRKNFMNFEHFFGGNSSIPRSSSSNIGVASNERTQHQNQDRDGTQDDNSIEDANATKEPLMKLLMYRVNIGWSD